MTYTETLEANKFVAELSEEHKIIFLKALVFLARIDNKLDEEEIRFIKDAAEKYHITQTTQIFEKLQEDEILRDIGKFDNRRIKLELIKELCLLGHSDSDLSDEETLFIGHAGLAMGIDLEKIEQISNWIIDKIIWLERGKEIFND